MHPEGTVDPADGATHRVPVPDGLVEIQGDGTGRLEGIVRTGSGPASVFVWSEDGGETWSEHDLPGEETSMFGLTPSGDPGTAAVIGGADGAILFPFIDVSRLDRRSGVAADPPAPGPRAYIGPQAVLPDGRLLANVQVWSDPTFKKPGARPNGVYTSDGRGLVDHGPAGARRGLGTCAGGARAGPGRAARRRRDVGRAWRRRGLRRRGRRGWLISGLRRYRQRPQVGARRGPLRAHILVRRLTPATQRVHREATAVRPVLRSAARCST